MKFKWFSEISLNKMKFIFSYHENKNKKIQRCTLFLSQYFRRIAYIYFPTMLLLHIKVESNIDYIASLEDVF